MRVRVRLPEPHSDKQRQIFQAFVTPGLREMWIACGSKFGKTMSLACAFALAMPLRPQTMWRWIAPIYAQALIGRRYCARVLPKAPFVRPDNSSPPALTIPSIDSTLQFWHGQHPEDLEGEGSHGNGLDEAAKHKEQVYVSAKTTTTMTRGPQVMASTPRGKNWFFKGYNRAREEMARAAHEGRQPLAVAIHAPTWENPLVTPEAIEEMRRSLPARLFKQYVEAEFLDDGSVFEGLVDAFGRPASWWTEDVWFASTHDSKVVYVGADWAKKEDFTVFVALSDEGRLVGFKRFQKLPYPAQVASLFAFMQQCRANSTLVGCQVMSEHDQTGVGEAVNDVIQATNNDGLDIIGIIWTNKLKEVYVNDLVLSFQEKVLHMVPWGVMRDELEAFEVTTSMSGKCVYGAPEGMHDDTVMALVLANKLFREGRGSISNVVLLDTLQNMVRQIQFSGGMD